MAEKPKILVCPLDWGIGHATRMVPIIHELQEQGAEVHVGASGRSLAFLQMEFPALSFIDFPGYPVAYSNSKWGMAWKIMRQLPALLNWTRKEHRQLDQLIRDHKYSGVISDNRYGLWSEKVPCIFITHQVFVQTPGFMRFLSPLIGMINRNFILKYRECWIPDKAGDKNLSGALSHHRPLSPHYHFIGPLSRFYGMETSTNSLEKAPVHYDVLAVLSGPEPQRSILEKKILASIKGMDIRAAMVLGKPGSEEIQYDMKNCDIHTHLESTALLELIRISGLVLARSGYSTIMDLAAVRKNAVLIPTPGQTEQEYLARYLMGKKYCFAVSQHKFDLKDALDKAETYPGLKIDFDRSALKARIARFLQMT